MLVRSNVCDDLIYEHKLSVVYVDKRWRSAGGSVAKRQNEVLPYGVTLKWSDDDRIATVATEGNMARPAVDTWADLTIRVVREWTPGQHLSILFNLTGPKQGYSPYVTKRTIDVYRSAPSGLTGDVAIVMQNTIVVRLLMILVQREGQIVGGRITQRFFLDLQEAHEWLRSRLPAPEATLKPNPGESKPDPEGDAKG
jgi:hypothetical protein